jgi:hypothetical protein
VGAMKTNLQYLIQKEVSRKEFLTIVGLAILSIFGMETILKLLTGKSLSPFHISVFRKQIQIQAKSTIA